jgi:hypothetical protein
MRQKNTPAGGRPGRGKSGESNRPHYTSLRFRLQAIEGHLLLILIFIEQVVREVTR